MRTHVLQGSKAEIADALAKIKEEIYQVIVCVVDPEIGPPIPPGSDFSEMDPYMVHVDTFVDDSREAIYTRMEGE